MEFKCNVCNVTVHSEKFWTEHLNGKKHKEGAEQKARMDALAHRSVYLNNFTHPIVEAEVRQAMDQFGEVDRVVPDRSAKNGFAIVEFREASAAQNLLQSLKRVRIGKSNVRIQPRRVAFDSAAGTSGGPSSHDVYEQRGMSSAEVLHCLEGLDTLEAQMQALVVTFSMSQEIVNARAEFAQSLNQFFQAYFSSTIHIRIFGSSSTGLGFVNSDLDLILVFDEDLLDSSDNSPEDQSEDGAHMEIHDSTENTPDSLRANPMRRDAFVQLSKMEQIRLLNRLMNAFRKEHGLITSHVPIPDARTPVLRFVLRHPPGLPCELSVQNLLSECKANLVRDLVRAENTGTLWRLLFLLKLWATANGLFSPALSHQPEKGEHQQQQHPKAHWNSYTFSLLAIAYLQHRGRIPPMQLLIRPNSRAIRGWRIEYDLSFFALDDGLVDLLKGLLVFIYHNCNEKSVIVLREGQVMKREEFKARFVDTDGRIEKKWRFAAVNVQDPLELSHNVAANVGKQYLSTLRWKAMYAIAVLKQSPNDIHRLFQLDSIQQLQAQKRAQNKQKQAEKGAVEAEGTDMEVDQ